MPIQRSHLLNRFTISCGIIALLVIGVNVYVAGHDDGILEGQVIGPEGKPVQGARVTVYKPGVVGFDRIDEAVTDGNGRFRFEKHNQHHPVLRAEKEGLGRSEYEDVRLYFRNENRVHKIPLRLRPED